MYFEESHFEIFQKEKLIEEQEHIGKGQGQHYCKKIGSVEGASRKNNRKKEKKTRQSLFLQVNFQYLFDEV